MRTESIVRARIDERTKEQAALALKAMGLTLSDAVRLMLIRVANEKKLPFDPLIPNPETIEALEASRKRETQQTESIAALFASLNADD